MSPDQPSRPDGRWKPSRTDGAAPDRLEDDDNFLTELNAIAARLERLKGASREEFSDGSPSYDTASMAVIRLQALTEDKAYEHNFATLQPEDLAGIRGIRNVISHRGYAHMNDDAFWDAVMKRLPAVIERLRLSVRG